MDAMTRIRSQPGLSAKIAKGLGITRGAVAMWDRVPANRITDVSRITGIPAAELRPDLAAHFEPAAAPSAVEAA